MTDDRSLERAARSWLEVGPTHAPARAVEAALLRIETTPQERVLRVPWRFTTMPMPARVAAAAAIGVLLLGGAFYLVSRPGQPSVGVPGPSPSATASPSVTSSPSASAALAFQAAPTRALGDWQAMSDTEIPGLYGANEHIQLSVDWQDGMHAWIQTVDGSWVLKSATLQAPADEINLVTAAGADAVGCADGDVGRYRWSRSDDGMFLTLTVIEDACAKRAEAMSRTWVHSLSAVTDGGLGVVPFEDAWLQATLPQQRFGLSGEVSYTDLRAFEGPDRGLFAIKDPFGIDAPCGTDRQPLEILDTPTKFVAYVQTLPGFTVATEEATVAGLPATHVTITPEGSATCQADGSIVAFHSRFPTGADGELGISASRAHSMWIVAAPKDAYLFIYEGEAVTPDEEASVISSIRFLDDLPKP